MQKFHLSLKRDLLTSKNFNLFRIGSYLLLSHQVNPNYKILRTLIVRKKSRVPFEMMSIY